MMHKGTNFSTNNQIVYKKVYSNLIFVCLFLK